MTIRQFLLYSLATLACSAPAAAQSTVDDERPPGSYDDDDEPAPTTMGPDVPDEPPRWMFTLGAGGALRIVNDLDFEQTRFAPPFVDLGAAHVFASGPALRHAVGLTLSTNINGDGGISDGVDPFTQLTLAPRYAVYVRSGLDFVITAHAALAFNVAPDFTPGAEIGGGAAYFVTAGLGVYAELAAAAYLGAESTVHPMVTGEAGIMIDYEVLP